MEAGRVLRVLIGQEGVARRLLPRERVEALHGPVGSAEPRIERILPAAGAECRELRLSSVSGARRVCHTAVAIGRVCATRGERR